MAAQPTSPRSAGIIVTAGAIGTRILGNTIEANNGCGVAIVGTPGNPGIDNLISGNGAFGTDLGANGISANDVGHADGGPDNPQNFPTLGNVVIGNDSATLTANLVSWANQNYLLALQRAEQQDRVELGHGHCDVSGWRHVGIRALRRHLRLYLWRCFRRGARARANNRSSNAEGEGRTGGRGRRFRHTCA